MVKILFAWFSTSRIGKSLKNKEIVVIYEDITERKKSEETLRKSQQEFTSLFKSSPEAAIYHDEQGIILNINPRFTKLFGYTLEEVKGKNINEGMIFPQNKTREESERLTKLASEGKIIEHETIRKKKDGSLVPVIISISPVIIGGQNKGIIAFYQDITKQKSVLETIKKSEERFHDLFENANDAIWTADTKGRYISVNRLFRKLLGYKKEELIGKKSIYLIAPESRQESIENYKKALSGKAVEYKLNLLNKDGEKRIYLERLRPLKENGKIIGVQGIGRDIAERKQNEKLQQFLYNISRAANSPITLDQLYKTIHQELGKIIDTTNFYIALLNEKEDKVYFPYHVDEMGDEFEPQSLEYKSLTCYVIKNRRPLLLNYDKIKELNKNRELLNLGVVTKNIFWFGVPLKVEDKVIGAMVVQSYTNPNLYSKKDIKLMEFVSNQVAIAIERKRAEESLRKSQQELANIFKNIPQAVVYLDENSNIKDISPRFTKLFGYTLVEIKGKNINEGIIHPPGKIKEGNNLDETILSEGYFNYETIRKKKDGTLFSVSISGSNIVIDGQLKGIIGTYFDITERKKLEEKLKRYARYDTLTKACNRRYGLDLLKQQLKLAKRNKSPLLLAYIDLDDFKNVNDKFGHEEGDQILKKIAKMFKSTLREVDIIIRIGGDEFLLILPDSSLDDIPLIKKRMNEALAKLNQKLDKSYKVSFTLGFSCYDSDNPCTIDELIQTADQMMYKEKKSIN
jgi:diguanylate cyclase (GGDEF)-like protein/PAS domain S-box-containing protein